MPMWWTSYVTTCLRLLIYIRKFTRPLYGMRSLHSRNRNYYDNASYRAHVRCSCLLPGANWRRVHCRRMFVLTIDRNNSIAHCNKFLVVCHCVQLSMSNLHSVWWCGTPFSASQYRLAFDHYLHGTWMYVVTFSDIYPWRYSCWVQTQ